MLSHLKSKSQRWQCYSEEITRQDLSIIGRWFRLYTTHLISLRYLITLFANIVYLHHRFRPPIIEPKDCHQFVSWSLKPKFKIKGSGPLCQHKPDCSSSKLLHHIPDCSFCDCSILGQKRPTTKPYIPETCLFISWPARCLWDVHTR